MQEIEGVLSSFYEKDGGFSEKIFAIASGKGGVGKTTLSVNMAAVFAKMGREVILFDADLGLANVGVFLDASPKYTLFDVIKGDKTMEDILFRTKEGFQIIPGSAGFHEMANLSKKEKLILVEKMGNLHRADIVFIDIGAGISDNVLNFIHSAGGLIIVTTSEPAAVMDAYGLMKAVAFYGFKGNIYLLVNRVKNFAEGEKIIKRLLGVAKKFLNLQIVNLGIIIDDPLVFESIMAQKLVVKMYPHSVASKCIKNICLTLEGVSLGDHNMKKKSGLINFFKNIIMGEKK